MSNATITVFIIILILLGGIAGFLYFKYDKGKLTPEEIQASKYYNLYLKTYDENFTQVKTNFFIIAENNTVSYHKNSSETQLESFLMPVNMSFLICNYDYSIDAKYYSFCKEYKYNPSFKSGYKLEYFLKDIGYINYTIDNILNGQPIFINLNITKTIKNLNICTRESLNIYNLEVKTQEPLEQASIPDRYKYKIDNCQRLPRELYNENFNFTLNYGYRDSLVNEYIRVYLIDEDLDVTTNTNVTGIMSLDIGAKDIEIEIK